MSSDVIDRLRDADFHFTNQQEISDLPQELIPQIITEDGVLIEFIANSTNTLDDLFATLGKVIAIQEYLQEFKLTPKYTAVLALTVEEFKSYHSEMRKSIYQEVPLIIL